MTPRAKKAARALLRGEQVDMSGWPQGEVLQVLDHCQCWWEEKLAWAKSTRARVQAKAERVLADLDHGIRVAEQALAQLRELREQAVNASDQAG